MKVLTCIPGGLNATLTSGQASCVTFMSSPGGQGSACMCVYEGCGYHPSVGHDMLLTVLYHQCISKAWDGICQLAQEGKRGQAASHGSCFAQL